MKIRLPETSRSKKIMRLFFLLALLCFVLGGLFQQLWVKNNGFSSGSIKETRDWNDIKRVNIIATNLDFIIESWDNPTVQIVYHNDTPLVFESTEFDELVIKQREDEFRLTLFTPEKYQYKATVYLPEKGIDKVTLTTKSGSMDTRGYSQSLLELHSNNGTVHAKSGEHPLHVTTRTGHIFCDLDPLLSAVRIETQSGNTVIQAVPNTAVKLSYQTQQGAFETDYFKDNPNINGGRELVYGNNPVSVFVKSDTGNLSFLTIMTSS